MRAARERGSALRLPDEVLDHGARATVDGVSAAYLDDHGHLAHQVRPACRLQACVLVADDATPGRDENEIRPRSRTTNPKGVAIFEVSDTTIQKVIYRATDLTDGVLIYPSGTVGYVKP